MPLNVFFAYIAIRELFNQRDAEIWDDCWRGKNRWAS